MQARESPVTGNYCQERPMCLLSSGCRPCPALVYPVLPLSTGTRTLHSPPRVAVLPGARAWSFGPASGCREGDCGIHLCSPYSSYCPASSACPQQSLSPPWPGLCWHPQLGTVSPTPPRRHGVGVSTDSQVPAATHHWPHLSAPPHSRDSGPAGQSPVLKAWPF